jgi:hypothetical protein
VPLRKTKKKLKDELHKVSRLIKVHQKLGFVVSPSLALYEAWLKYYSMTGDYDAIHLENLRKSAGLGPKRRMNDAKE